MSDEFLTSKIDISNTPDMAKMSRGKSTWVKYIRARVNAVWATGIAHFVNTASERMRLYTGMAMGNLMPLAQALEGKTNLKLNPVVMLAGPVKKKWQHMVTEDTYPSQFDYQLPKYQRTHSKGVELGKESFKMRFLNPRSKKLRFTFEINVLSYYMMESSSHYSMSQDWRTIPLGKQAMMNYLESQSGMFDNSKVLQQLLYQDILTTRLKQSSADAAKRHAGYIIRTEGKVKHRLPRKPR